MKFGFFDDDRKEYVITTPRTPLPWINYLGNEDFFTLLSNTAGGYSFFRDARLRRITRYRYNNCPLDQEGFHLYIRDGDTVWNPGWQPVQMELDEYTCRHGLGYTVIEGKKNGVRVSQEFVVPVGERSRPAPVSSCSASATQVLCNEEQYVIMFSQLTQSRAGVTR